MDLHLIIFFINVYFRMIILIVIIKFLMIKVFLQRYDDHSPVIVHEISLFLLIFFGVWIDSGKAEIPQDQITFLFGTVSERPLIDSVSDCIGTFGDVGQISRP